MITTSNKRKKASGKIITGIILDSTDLTVNDADTTKGIAPANDYRRSNTTSDMTMKIDPIFLDRDNIKYEIGLDPSTSVPTADYNVQEARNNSIFYYTWNGADQEIQIVDGYKTITEIETEILAGMAAKIPPHITAAGPPIEYAIQFTNNSATSKVEIATDTTVGSAVALDLSPGGNGWAKGILGLFGYVGDGTELIDITGGVNSYVPGRTANINDQITSYYVNCNIARGTIDSRGKAETISTYLINSDFGDRQDFSWVGNIRFCELDPFIDRIDSIRVWVTDNLQRAVDWNGESATFALQLRETVLT